MDIAFLDSELFRWVILPSLIFVARILDVSIGTIRIVFVARGNRALSPLLGFFEVMIWLLAIGQIIRNLSNFLCYIAYSAGFAAGTFIGLLIEEKLAIGVLLVRIITRKEASELVSNLRAANYGVTVIPARGESGVVDVIYTVIHRRDLKAVLDTIKRFNPKAFYSIENVQSVREGIFPPQPRPLGYIPVFGRLRKGK
jgi:uncharacterized protein YebE (UPF0316 family)